MIEKLKILQANRGQFSTGRELSDSLLSDAALRQEIETLSKAFFRKSVSGCSNCYMDAYIQLMNLKIEDAMEKIACPFVLRAGALLRDINDYSKLCSQSNITTELALHHLSVNPNSKKLFVKLPENWEAQVAEFEQAQKETVEDLTDETAGKFTTEEEMLIVEIQKLLAAGTTITEIKTTYGPVKTVGDKKLTGVLLATLIKEAQGRIK